MAQGETQQIVEAIALPLILIAGTERIVQANRAARAIFGTGLVDRHYVTVLRQPVLLEAIEATLRQRAERSARIQVTSHGRDSEYEVRAAPVTLDGLPAAVVSFLDVTHLSETGQIRRDFVANVSHELRTPLTAMSGFIETLRGAAKDDPAARERFLGVMAGEADRMNRLVQDLLSLSRVEAQERMRPTAAVNIPKVMRASVARLRAAAHQKGVEIEEVVEGEDLEAPGDADQLTQVFTNLIENALKYGAGGGRITVRIARLDHEPSLRGPAVQVDVIDYGEGIDPIHVPRLTERFYRVDDHRSREMGGTGLGLAIVKHIVSRHRGRLRVKSVRGQGSEFSVLLPQG